MYIKTYKTKTAGKTKSIQVTIHAPLMKILGNINHIYHIQTKDNEYYLSTQPTKEDKYIIDCTSSKLTKMPKSKGKLLTIPQRYLTYFDIEKDCNLYLELYLYSDKKIIKVSKVESNEIKQNDDTKPLTIARFKAKINKNYNIVLSSIIMDLLDNPSKLYYLKTKQILTPNKPEDDSNYKVHKIQYNRKNTGTINIHESFYPILKENNIDTFYLDLIQTPENDRFIQLTLPNIKKVQINPNKIISVNPDEKRNRIYFTIPSENFLEFEKVFLIKTGQSYYISPEVPDYLNVVSYNIIKLKHEDNLMNFSIPQSLMDISEDECNVYYYDIENEKPVIQLENSDDKNFIEMNVIDDSKEEIMEQQDKDVLDYVQIKPKDTDAKIKKARYVDEFDTRIIKVGHQLRTVLPKELMDLLNHPSILYHVKTLTDKPKYYLCEDIPPWENITYQSYKIQNRHNSKNEEISIPKKYCTNEGITNEFYCQMKLYENNQINYLEIEFKRKNQ